MKVLTIVILLAGGSFATVFALTTKSGQPGILSTNTSLQTTGNESGGSLFAFKDNILTISTNLIEIKVEAGIIIYALDKSTGEVFVQKVPALNPPLVDHNYVGYISQDAFSGDNKSNWPNQFSQVSFNLLSQYSARLVYTSLSSKLIKNNNQLIMDLNVDPQSGEVIIQLTGIDENPQFTLTSINLPILNITKKAVILGSGEIIYRSDLNNARQTSNPQYGLFSPSIQIIQGDKSVLASWSEPSEYVSDYIILKHSPSNDQVILHSENAAKLTPPNTIISPPWRIGVYPNWLNAAKRWRERFEQRTGAKPLWENSTPWVRNIHAVFDSTYQDYGSGTDQYAQLARLVPADKLAYLLWNGDRIVLFGDYTLAEKIGLPTPAILNAVNTYGWKLILYHPFDLIYSENGTQNRLAFLQDQGWLPQNYQFTPDYPGSADSWHQYWSSISANYENGEKLSVLHPGAAIFQNYLVQNVRRYSAMYAANGLYFDTLGVDEDHFFPQDQRIIDGSNYVTGVIHSMTLIKNTFPDLAVMSEYQTTWILPYAFFSWEGSATHQSQSKYVPMSINHPLRVALTGSYAWTRESNEEDSNIRSSALFGALPQISLKGDHNISSEWATWSQMRAKLFCDEELFNDLPDQWDEGVLAYYRSQRTGHWFKLVQSESGFLYLEIMEDGSQLIRLNYTKP